MLILTPEQSLALASRNVMRRMFIWCEARNPETGEPDPAGFWDDVGNVTFDGRTYYGSGIFAISTLTAKSNLTIPGLTITMSGVSQEVVKLVRQDTVGQAPIEVHLGIFDVDTRAVIPPLIRRFKGFVDEPEVKTPPAGGKSTILLNCESAARALTIKGTGTRSASTQRQRKAADAFYDHTAATGELALYFGRAAP